jgi:hypothetical protein
MEIKCLFARGLSKRKIAKRLKIGRTSVRRVLTQKKPPLSVLYFESIQKAYQDVVRRSVRDLLIASHRSAPCAAPKRDTVQLMQPIFPPLGQLFDLVLEIV